MAGSLGCMYRLLSWRARLGGPFHKLRSLDHVCFVLSRAGHPSSLSKLAGPPWRALVILQSERVLCGIRASRRSSSLNLVRGGRPPSLPHGLYLSSSAGPPWRVFLKFCFLDVYVYFFDLAGPPWRVAPFTGVFQGWRARLGGPS